MESLAGQRTWRSIVIFESCPFHGSLFEYCSTETKWNGNQTVIDETVTLEPPLNCKGKDKTLSYKEYHSQESVHKKVGPNHSVAL